MARPSISPTTLIVTQIVYPASRRYMSVVRLPPQFSCKRPAPQACTTQPSRSLQGEKPRWCERSAASTRRWTAASRDPNQLPRGERRERGQYGRHERAQVGDVVASRPQRDHPERERRNALLELDHSIPLSTVTKAAKPAAPTRGSSAPFFVPAHPCCCTVITSWPGSSRRSPAGRHSSSRTRTRA